MGKGVQQLAALCYELKVPCVGWARMLGRSAKVKRSFIQAYGLTDLTSLEQAKARPEFWLKQLAEQAAKAAAALPLEIKSL
jgi:hypothetical protein